MAAEIRRRWLEAGERFAQLGTKFQERYEAASTSEAEERLQSAVSDAIAAIDEVLVAAGWALGDRSLREDAQYALSALHDALKITFTDATEEIEAAAERIRIGLANLPHLEEDPATAPRF